MCGERPQCTPSPRFGKEGSSSIVAERTSFLTSYRSAGRAYSVVCHTPLPCLLVQVVPRRDTDFVDHTRVKHANSGRGGRSSASIRNENKRDRVLFARLTNQAGWCLFVVLIDEVTNPFLDEYDDAVNNHGR